MMTIIRIAAAEGGGAGTRDGSWKSAFRDPSSSSSSFRMKVSQVLGSIIHKCRQEAEEECCTLYLPVHCIQ